MKSELPNAHINAQNNKNNKIKQAIHLGLFSQNTIPVTTDVIQN